MIFVLACISRWHTIPLNSLPIVIEWKKSFFKQALITTVAVSIMTHIWNLLSFTVHISLSGHLPVQFRCYRTVVTAWWPVWHGVRTVVSSCPLHRWTLPCWYGMFQQKPLLLWGGLEEAGCRCWDGPQMGVNCSQPLRPTSLGTYSS